MSDPDEFAEDPGDDAAAREALHDQLRIDAALTAHLGGARAERRLKASVMATLQAGSEVRIKRRVLASVSPRPGGRRAAGRFSPWEFAKLAAAAVLVLGTGWWLLAPGQQPGPEATVAVGPLQPRPVVDLPPAPKTVDPVDKVDAVDPVDKGGSVVIAMQAPVIPAVPDIPPVPQVPPVPPVPLVPPVPPVASVPLVPPVASGTPVVAKAPALAGVTAVRTREAARWPFSAESPWNRSVGLEAVFEPVRVAGFGGQAIGYHGRTIVRATAEQPLVRVRQERGAGLKVRFAPGWADLQAGRVNPVTVIEENGEWAWEYYDIHRERDAWVAGDAARFSLKGKGAGQEGRGVGVAGVPSMACVIRAGEWQTGIPHAVALIVPFTLLHPKPVWPAQPPAFPDASNFNKHSDLHLGTLLALPPEANPQKLGLTEGSAAFHLANALWNHGAYILSTNRFAEVALFVEGTVPEEADRAEIQRVISLLQVVRNNSRERPGGGGKPRGVVAPPWK